jgi:hypothetical protein
MKAKQEHLQFYFPVESKNKLRELAERNGLTLSQLAKSALLDYLELVESIDHEPMTPSQRIAKNK